jgi:hypothetical protein
MHFPTHAKHFASPNALARDAQNTNMRVKFKHTKSAAREFQKNLGSFAGFNCLGARVVENESSRGGLI